MRNCNGTHPPLLCCCRRRSRVLFDYYPTVYDKKTAAKYVFNILRNSDGRFNCDEMCGEYKGYVAMAFVSDQHKTKNKTWDRKRISCSDFYHFLLKWPLDAEISFISSMNSGSASFAIHLKDKQQKCYQFLFRPLFVNEHKKVYLFSVKREIPLLCVH